MHRQLQKVIQSQQEDDITNHEIRTNGSVIPGTQSREGISRPPGGPSMTDVVTPRDKDSTTYRSLPCFPELRMNIAALFAARFCAPEKVRMCSFYRNDSICCFCNNGQKVQWMPCSAVYAVLFSFQAY
ncbi:hypothetical protein CDAR_565771 [Caerostris darwini]|uniref:Uncharacterized protein n=1 Tax=Caerostris darwini TaxID=1538125 RepID=A0AAV4UYU0_9ARAC|nr:hypothetical protein CDAR_565771 [Caerostris darwini]